MAYSERVLNLLKEMNDSDKARQLTQVNAFYVHAETAAQATGVSGDLNLSDSDIAGVGSVLNFGDAADAERIRRAHLSKGENQVPLVMMQDVIHGYRTIYPVPLALGCSFDLSIVEECAYISARESAVNGVDVTFSPMVDLVRDPRWGRVMETTGEDPYLNGLMGRAMIRGYRRGGMGSCVKHFAAYGAAEGGRDYNTTDVSERNLKEYYLRAYRECLKENPELVMTSFNLLNGVPVNGHKDLLVDLLRDEWGFDGVVVSDYGAVREMIKHGYVETERECAAVCAANGVDMEMMSSCYIHNLPDLVKSGEIPRETVDKMVLRVLDLKERLGLLDEPYARVDAAEAERRVLCAEHRAVALKAAEKSCVLLKNSGILPLERGKKILLLGPYADEKNLLGAWRCAGRPEESVSVKEGIEKLTGEKVDCVKVCSWELSDCSIAGIPQTVKLASGADVIIACLGEPYNASGEGASRADLRLPATQRVLIQALRKAGKPIIAVIFAGRPQILTDIEPLCDAILYAWQPGTEGGNAVARLIFGDAKPSGRLAMSFPRSVGQIPVYYNCFTTGRPKGEDVLENCGYNSSYRDELNAPLYPFGYGLGYTTFAYSPVKLSADRMQRGGKICASVTVTNTGKREGEETVQLYIRDMFASVVRPVKELKGFKKVALKAGETSEVSFEITEDMLAFFTAGGEFKAESGEFTVTIGGDSRSENSAKFRLL